MTDTTATPTPHETLLQKIEALPGELWQLARNKGYAPAAADEIKALVADGAAGVKDAAQAVVAVAEPALAASEIAWPAVLKPFAPMIVALVDGLLEKERDELVAKAAAEQATLDERISAWGAAKAALPA